MSETTHLKLPYLAAAQAQKHVTANEGLSALDSFVQCAVLDPPASPADGDRYILGGSPTGVWAGKAHSLAVWRDGAWTFHDAQAVWRVFNLADCTLYVLDATFSWTPIGGPPASGAEVQLPPSSGLGPRRTPRTLSRRS